MMEMGSRILLFIILSISGITQILSQNPALEKGKVIDTVFVDEEKNESFALYLPEKYNSDKDWPIVYIFDPAARGRLAIEHFQKAARQYNLILVCSNNAQNAPFEKNFDIANRLFANTFEQFSIDKTRIYIAGFSGGARLATAIAVFTNKFAGVIACGAGFSHSTAHRPTNFNEFSYVGIVGNKDMNYLELKSGHEWLNKISLPNYIIEYEGGHKWPPDSVILQAFNWLQLETFRKGIKNKNESFIDSLYRQYYTEAKKTEITGELYTAYTSYKDITQHFSPFYKLDSVKEITERLKKTKSIRKTLNKKEKIREREEKLVRTYFEMLSEQIVNNEISKDDYEYWENEMKKIRSLKESENKEVRNMAYRIINKFWVWGYEKGEEFLRNNNYEKAIFAHHLMRIIKPDDPYPYFRLAKDYTLTGNKKKAIYYTGKGIEIQNKKKN